MNLLRQTKNVTAPPGSATRGCKARFSTALALAVAAAMLAACGAGDAAKTPKAGSAPQASTALAAPVRTVTAATLSTGTLASGFAVPDVDQQLADLLKKHGFTGKVEQSLERRLGRPVNPKLAELGRQVFFDRIVGLHSDNACAGCHSPSHGFGDTQSISIGIQNNLLVGPDRLGPRNQRRAPSVVNTAFYPNLMWNGRFASASGDPFDTSQGFVFPPPEGTVKFAAGDPRITHLLIAHAHMPPTELNEAAGFTGVRNGVNPRLWMFDDGLGTPVPDVDASGFRNDAIRAAVMDRFNASPDYVKRFGDVFPGVKLGARIDITMFARALAEFEFTLVRANAPIDRYARGDTGALKPGAKRGAVLFFGRANCVACHAVGGQSNEMFSDFKMHNIGVPQIAPAFGLGTGDTIFDGPGEDEDYGLAQVSGLDNDRYMFRTSPLRNVALQPTFFHNGAFTRLADAVRHHLDVAASLRKYDPAAAGVARDLRDRIAPREYVSATLDPLVSTPTNLSEQEVSDLVEFVRDGLLDPEAKADKLCPLAPKALVSRARPLKFENCK